MKSKCKPIDLSKRDKIKATVSYLIFCYLFVFLAYIYWFEIIVKSFIWWHRLDYSAIYSSSHYHYNFHTRFTKNIGTSRLEYENWSVRYLLQWWDGRILCWMDGHKKIVLVHTRDSILSMEVTTNIGKRKVIDLSLCSLYPYRVHRLARMYSCGKCQVVDKNSLKG